MSDQLISYLAERIAFHLSASEFAWGTRENGNGVLTVKTDKDERAIYKALKASDAKPVFITAPQDGWRMVVFKDALAEVEG